MQKETAFFKAPAKINLHLHVFPRRSDGFHEIESVFARLDLCDEMSFCLAESGCKIVCKNFDLPAENTISKALDIFCGEAQKKVGLEVALNKKIPSQAGLGGGSSDGAIALKALDFLCKTNFSKRKLMKMAEKIGSDAPFFLQDSPFAVAGGRGEVLQGCFRKKSLFVVIVKGDEGVSTAKAYADLDLDEKNFLREKMGFDFLQNELSKNPSEWRFFNSFSPVVSRQIPEIQDEIDLLMRNGALFAEMTGSGSAVFGIFNSAKSAEKASEIAKKNKKYSVSSCIK